MNAIASYLALAGWLGAWATMAVAAEPPTMPLLLHEDFESGAARWQPTEASKWRIERLPDGGHAYQLLGKSDYQPPHRSPHSIAMLEGLTVGDFELTARVKTLQTSRGHRDMCVIFGHQDPAHFYYVHLGERTDDHANQIFVVDDAPRIKISERTSAGTPWRDDTWHQVRVVRRVADGLIEVYFDDMTRPQMVAHDRRFQSGRIGLGSFDDMGLWDDVRIWGAAVDAAAAPQPAADPVESGAAEEPADAAAASGKTSRRADPATLQFSKWSGPINVPDPVAISLDHAGRAYVTQTQRRKSQDLDIRANQDWIADDVGFRSVDDKRRFYRQQMPIGGDSEAAAKRVADLNGDGAHDWRDLTVISEKIHVLEDTDGDGTADAMHLFAEGFQTEVTGIAAGVLWKDGDVYATIAPDLWRLRDTDGDGAADRREAIVHGFGVHIAYAGHDMHGLAVGPDGKIYWSIGDKGISVTTAAGEQFLYPNEGGVMRCNPDGSDFEVFAHGLRNVQEFAFDAEGNMFGVDNDADGAGEQERFVYIVPEMDAGWRCNYQYMKDGYCPWWDEALWQPRSDRTPSYLLPPIRNYVDGPAGFAFNPGTALSPAYRDYFFLTEAPNGFQYAFRAEPDGASFRMVDEHGIGQGVPLVGINFGPDGALYGVDWGGGYPLNQQGAVWKIDVPEYAGSAERLQVQQWLQEGCGQRSDDQLVDALGHADQRIRLEAQFELVRRRQTAALLAVSADPAAPRLARTHAIWGLGQLARQGDTAAVQGIQQRLADPLAAVRVQAARTARDVRPIGDVRPIDGARLVQLMADADPQVRFHAALAAARHPSPGLFDAAVQLIARDAADDAYLQHAGIVALTAADQQRRGEGLAAALAQHPLPIVRQSAVVALRRGADAAVASFLNDSSEAVVAEAARAIYDDLSIPAALPALAQWLETPQSTNEVIVRRAIYANFRIGGAAEAERLVRLAARRDAPQEMRAEALRALALWTQPPLLDRVDGRRRELDPRQRAFRGSALRGPLTAVLQEADGTLPALAVTAMRSLQLPIAAAVMRQMVLEENLPDPQRIEALRTLAEGADSQALQAIRGALQADSSALRLAALPMLQQRDPAAAAEHALQWAASPAAATAERQLAIRLLGELSSDAARQWVAEELERLQQGNSDPAVRLELLAAAEAQAASDAVVATRLEDYLQHRSSDVLQPALVQYEACLVGGDPEAGERLFRQHLAAQCIRCHKLGGEGSEVGPDLKGIAKKRDPGYLLRAVVDPSADIDPQYLAKTFLLISGQVVQGVVQSENDKEIVLVDNRGQQVRVPQNQIEDQSDQRVSIMPTMTDVLTPTEIRDVVAFLRQLR